MIRAYLYIKRGFKLIISQDYYHQPQGVGKAFYPGEIKGYFNDLTGKTSWKGEVDSEDILMILQAKLVGRERWIQRVFL